MERYTLTGIRQMIVGYQKKVEELHQARVSMAHRKQNEHPKYAAMTEREFLQYKIENIRWFIEKGHEYEEKIKKLEKMLEKL